jgi:transposase
LPRPMELKSRKACFPKRRRRYGSTSPPLADVHPNPGPKKKCRRWEAKKDSKRTKLTEDEKNRINKLSAEGKSGDDIAHEIGRKEEAVRRWMKRRKYTGEMKRKERSRKRRVDATEDKESSTSRESPRKKPKKWKRFDDREQGYATALIDTGLSHRKTAKMMKRCRCTLDRRAKQNEEDQKTNATTASRLGRPRKTTPRDDRALARRADAPDEPSARSIAAESKIHNPDHAISTNTVCRRLKEQGEVPRRKIPKPRLTKEQKAARLRWVEAHRTWTLDQWNRVLWSDESPFTIVPTPSRKFVWIRKGKRAKNMKASVDPKQWRQLLSGVEARFKCGGAFMLGEWGILQKFREL